MTLLSCFPCIVHPSLWFIFQIESKQHLLLENGFCWTRQTQINWALKAEGQKERGRVCDTKSEQMPSGYSWSISMWWFPTTIRAEYRLLPWPRSLTCGTLRISLTHLLPLTNCLLSAPWTCQSQASCSSCSILTSSHELGIRWTPPETLSSSTHLK